MLKSYFVCPLRKSSILSFEDVWFQDSARWSWWENAAKNMLRPLNLHMEIQMRSIFFKFHHSWHEGVWWNGYKFDELSAALVRHLLHLTPPGYFHSRMMASSKIATLIAGKINLNGKSPYWHFLSNLFRKSRSSISCTTALCRHLRSSPCSMPAKHTVRSTCRWTQSSRDRMGSRPEASSCNGTWGISWTLEDQRLRCPSIPRTLERF